MQLTQLDTTSWAISSPRYSPALRFEAKATPGMHWDGVKRAWIGWPDAAASCVERLRARGVRVKVKGSLTPELDTRDGESQVRERFLRKLRDYQRAGVEFLVAQSPDGALLADDMGLGKTRQALHAIAAIGRPAIVVCPSFVRGVWQREIAKWLPKWKIVDLMGVKPKIRFGKKRRRIYLVHYDVVHAWVEKLMARTPPIEMIVFDEIHFLQSDRSRRSQACKELARHCIYKIGLSGTPMTSRPRDLWNPIDTLSEGRFGRPFDFYLRYCNAHRVEVGSPNNPKTVWDVKGSSHLDELGARMQFFMLRRTKSDVSLELPPRTRQVVEVEVATRKRVAFAKAWQSDKAMRSALSVAADGKLPRAVELIGNHVETGSKVVLFAYRKAVAELIAASLRAQGVNAQTVTGDVPAKKRQLIVDQQPTVLCVTMDATQVGIDFSYADVAVFVELHWVPSTLAQCEARLHRFGQKKPVLIQYVVALSTVDEIIRDAVIDKIEHFEGVVGKTDDGLRQSLDDTVLTNVEQLKKLYEKMKAQEAA